MTADTTAAPVRRQRLLLGLDCSTQSISAVVLDAVTRAVVHESTLRFDDALPGYATTHGVRRDARDPSVVLVPSLMLVEALDRILEELAMHSSTFALRDVVAISGSAQQHTSAYWRRGFELEECLAKTDATHRLVEALADAEAFALECGPSWMDSSTGRFCSELEESLGGAAQVARISGSRACPRFTGNQIAKLIHDYPDLLDKVDRVSLASSLMTSLLVGRFTAIDASDGSGMNLLDLSTKQWSPELVRATVKGASQPPGRAQELLLQALGEETVAPHSVVGSVHSFFQRKFGFRSDCQVVPFSGDNPCTLVGLGVSQPGDVAVSLGTSTTLLAVVDPLDTACASEEGHFFLNPTDLDTLMAMICIKNGALTREIVRDQCAGSSWAEFESLLAQSPVGNNGIVGFFMSDPEITPLTSKPGVVVFDDSEVPLQHATQLTPTANVRAIVESQCLALRLHAERLGISSPRRLIATGGGAASDGFLQVLADVFGVAVLRLQTGSNSAAIGAAFRALHALHCETVVAPFDTADALQFYEAARPRADAVAAYTSFLDRFGRLEAAMVQILR